MMTIGFENFWDLVIESLASPSLTLHPQLAWKGCLLPEAHALTADPCQHVCKCFEVHVSSQLLLLQA